MPLSSVLIRTAAALLALGIAGCVGSPARLKVEQAAALEAAVLGYGSEIRIWGDEAPPDMERRIALRQKQITERYRKERPPRRLNFLAISGGGENGAFGAGFLNGWTAAGTRPEFEVVTGISTGALIAPFAFLGPDYDDELKEVYTTIGPADVFRTQVIAGVLGGSALADPTPLTRTIAKYADEAMLDAIAAQYGRGRRLFVGTTNLDVGRPVIWDMGAIAASGRPDRLELFRKLLLASASIPGAFPPVRVEVTAGGQDFDELHVDGGVANQVFAYPAEFRLSRFKRQLYGADLELYVIRNAPARPEFAVVEPRLFPIGARSTSTLIKTQGIGDLYRLYMTSQRDGLDYNLVFIPDTFTHPLEHPFDTKYMNALYEEGYRQGRSGKVWRKGPPGFE